jgi:hypothetical protein
MLEQVQALSPMLVLQEDEEVHNTDLSVESVL